MQIRSGALAVCLAILACANAAAAPALMRFTVPPRVETPIEIKSVAGALCTIRSVDGNKGLVTAVADGSGIARIYVDGPKGSSRIIHLAVDCKTPGHADSYQIDLRANEAPTQQMPAPARTKFEVPKDARVRPPLSATEASNLSDDEILRRGYPLRPDRRKSPATYAAWLRIVSRQTVILPPDETPNPFMRHSPTRLLPSRGKSALAAATSSNWSGFRVSGPSGSFAIVEGDWVVPRVRQKGDAFSNTAASEWVGIDGVGGPGVDLVQAGSEQQVNEVFGFAITSYYLWTEFLPQQPSEQVISRISIAPGDAVFTQVKMANSATAKPSLPATFGVFVVDATPAGSAIAFETTVLTAVGTTSVPGINADWIMERPTSCDIFGCSLLDLASYGTASMGTGLAAGPSPGGVTLCCTAAATNITMVNGGTTLSTVARSGVMSMDFTFVNFH